MRRYRIAVRSAGLAVALASLAAIGCPKASDAPVVTSAPNDESSPPKAVETTDAEIQSVPESTDDGADTKGPKAETPPGDATASTPGIAIEKPGDFLAPAATVPETTAPQAPEPADPPEVVTDASAEAGDPLVLPDDTQIGDVFEGLEATKPVPE